MKSLYLENSKPSDCYGCSMCEKACPVKAIKMEQNNHGFLYPSFDNQKCIECGKCYEVCPINIDVDKGQNDIYQVAHKDIDVLKKSQSGGAFTAISDYALHRKGVVYGAAIKDDLSVCHIRAENDIERNRMSGSKYVQSYISSNLIEILENDLNNGKTVLFSGTPCQCAMIQKNYGNFENLIVCDFICHGVPSQKLWKRYLEYIEKENMSHIKKAVFRNKRCRKIGNYTESYYLENGEEALYNDYAALFYSHLAHRDTCFECQFATFDRYSDITIGGFLEPSDFESPYDSSMVIVNSSKGKIVFDEIKKDINYTQSNISFYKNQPCLYHPVQKPNQCDEFWHDFETEDIKYIIDKYATDLIKDKYKIRIMTSGEEY